MTKIISFGPTRSHLGSGGFFVPTDLTPMQSIKIINVACGAWQQDIAAVLNKENAGWDQLKV